MKAEQYQLPVEMMAKAIDKMDLESPQVYGQFLAQTFYYVSHSTRMLAFAAGMMKNSEEVHFRRFVRHIGEESAHEVLAEKDLQGLGMKVSDYAQLPETRALWEPQYYKILHVSPFALMGYVIALEYFSCAHLPRFYQKVLTAYGPTACRFVKLHAEEDPDHIVKALDLTSQLSEAVQESILVNIQQTAKGYSAMVNACGEFARQSRVKTKNEYGSTDLAAP